MIWKRKKVLVPAAILVLVTFLFWGPFADAVDKKISALAAQTSLNNGDYFAQVDTTATPTTKRVTWTTVKSFLKTYFDTLYEATGTVSTHNVSVAAHGMSAWSTCTPTLTCVGGTINTVPQYADTICRYSISNKTVFIWMKLSGDGGAEGSGSGTLTVALPVAESTNENSSVNNIGTYTNGTVISRLLGQFESSAITMPLVKSTGLSESPLVCGDQSSDTRSLYMRFFYEVD